VPSAFRSCGALIGSLVTTRTFTASRVPTALVG
jgi:hypothetical protein